MRQMQVFEPGDLVRHKATGAELVVKAVYMRSFKSKDGKDDFYFTLTLECPHCGEELTGKPGGEYEAAP